MKKPHKIKRSAVRVKRKKAPVVCREESLTESGLKSFLRLLAGDDQGMTPEEQVVLSLYGQQERFMENGHVWISRRLAEADIGQEDTAEGLAHLLERGLLVKHPTKEAYRMAKQLCTPEQLPVTG